MYIYCDLLKMDAMHLACTCTYTVHFFLLVAQKFAFRRLACMHCNWDYRDCFKNILRILTAHLAKKYPPTFNEKLDCPRKEHYLRKPFIKNKAKTSPHPSSPKKQ